MSRDPIGYDPFRANGPSSLLAFFLAIVSTSQDTKLRPALLIYSLRLIGNSCADTNENHDRVVQSRSLQHIINLLFSAVTSQDATMLPYVVPVLYNICVDYDPAQDAAASAGAAPALLSLATGLLARE